MNTKVQEIQKPESICLVMNKVDHTSIAFATLLYVALTENNNNIKLADVRDVLPQAAKYLWINAGTEGNVKGFLPYQSNYTDIYSNRVNPRTLLEDSFFIPDIAATNVEALSETVDGMLGELVALEFLSQEQRERVEGLYWVINTHTHAWSSCAGDMEGLAAYHTYLQACYRNYKRSSLTLEKIKEILSSKDTEEFLELSQGLNDIFSKHVLMTHALGDTTVFLNFMDEEIYLVIRRILSSKHKFYHLTEGLYGPVAFTNIGHILKLGDRPTLMLQDV